MNWKIALQYYGLWILTLCLSHYEPTHLIGTTLEGGLVGFLIVRYAILMKKDNT
jgi:hypothetical protein